MMVYCFCLVVRYVETESTLIEVRGLCKSYGGRQVLSDVSFVAKNGFVTGFVGPNGAGKSTTMRMVACLEKPDQGEALVDGQPFAQAACPGRAMGVYLGQGYLPTHMTGVAYLAYVCNVANARADRVRDLLDMVELTDAGNKEIGSYSLGMKQRIGIAAALANNPTTLMLDEPVNGLDPMGVQWLRNILRERAAQGTAVLLSSHLLSELELVADRVVMLDHGHVVARGDMSELERSGEARVLVRTSDDEAMLGLLARAGVQAHREESGLVVEGLSTLEVCKVAFDANLLMDHLEETHSSLEEVFMARAKRKEEGGEGNE